MDCQIHDSTLVRKCGADGRWMYTYQCVLCGQIDRSKTPSGGVWVAKSAVIDPESLPVFNESLCQSVLRRTKEAALAIREAERQEWWDRYDEYLQTDAWFDKRERVLRRDKYLCQGCLETEANHVHHMTYERLFNELLCDLVSLCGPCHQLCHPYKDILGRSWHGRFITVH